MPQRGLDGRFGEIPSRAGQGCSLRQERLSPGRERPLLSHRGTAPPAPGAPARDPRNRPAAIPSVILVIPSVILVIPAVIRVIPAVICVVFPVAIPIVFPFAVPAAVPAPAAPALRARQGSLPAAEP